MAISKRDSSRRIFFPWETEGGVRRFVRLAQVGPGLVALALLGFVWVAAARERHASGERQTILALGEVKRAVVRYVVEHEGRCPESLDLLKPYLKETPRDGWGRPIRIVCQPTVSDADYIIMSDGPDGLPGGLDRIEY